MNNSVQMVFRVRLRRDRKYDSIWSVGRARRVLFISVVQHVSVWFPLSYHHALGVGWWLA
jgi:hypothetical protein